MGMQAMQIAGTGDAGTGDAGTGMPARATSARRCWRPPAGAGAGLVVEAVGSLETFPLSLDLAAAGATLVWFGLPEGPGDYPFSFHQFFRRAADRLLDLRRPG